MQTPIYIHYVCLLNDSYKDGDLKMPCFLTDSDKNLGWHQIVEVLIGQVVFGKKIQDVLVKKKKQHQARDVCAHNRVSTLPNLVNVNGWFVSRP